MAGVTIRLHASMLLLLVWLLIEHLRAAQWSMVAEGALLLVCVFSFVLLHELGHVVVARRFGIHTRDITLLPFGGVASMAQMPERPREEALVALAGPAVNLTLAALFFFGLVVAQAFVPLTALRVAGGPFVAKLMLINVAMGAFNLLPAFPMDGGRVLRALLSTRMTRLRATQVAAKIAQLAAIGLGGAGLLQAPMLIVIAVFVWMGAQQELTAMRLAAELEGLSVSDAMVTQFRALDFETPTSEAVELSIGGFQHDFPILREGRLAGLLTHEALLDLLRREGDNGTVGSGMRPTAVVLEPGAPLSRSLEVMRAERARAAAVVDHGKLIGMLTPENVAERLMADKARSSEPRSSMGEPSPS